MRRIDLRLAHLTHCQLDDTNLGGAQARFVRFGPLRLVNLDALAGQKCHIPEAQDCSFRKADLAECWFFRPGPSQFVRCDFTEANLTKGHPSDWQGELISCDFSAASLSGADPHYVRCVGCIFRKANLTGADLCDVDLSTSDLAGAILQGVRHDERTRWPAGLTPPQET